MAPASPEAEAESPPVASEVSALRVLEFPGRPTPVDPVPRGAFLPDSSSFFSLLAYKTMHDEFISDISITYPSKGNKPTTY